MELPKNWDQADLLASIETLDADITNLEQSVRNSGGTPPERPKPASVDIGGGKTWTDLVQTWEELTAHKAKLRGVLSLTSRPPQAAAQAAKPQAVSKPPTASASSQMQASTQKPASLTARCLSSKGKPTAPPTGQKLSLTDRCRVAKTAAK